MTQSITAIQSGQVVSLSIQQDADITDGNITDRTWQRLGEVNLDDKTFTPPRTERRSRKTTKREWFTPFWISSNGDPPSIKAFRRGKIYTPLGTLSVIFLISLFTCQGR